MSQNVQLIGASREAIAKIGFGGEMLVISPVHQRIHEGVFFQADRVDTAVVNDGTVDLLVRIPSTLASAHMRFRMGAGGDAEVELYENPTVTAPGTANSIQNRNRVLNTSPEVTVFHTSTLAGDGTLIAQEIIPGGNFFITAGGAISSFEEWVLKPDEDYLFRVINKAGSDQPVSASLDWYEVGVGA